MCAAQVHLKTPPLSPFLSLPINQVITLTSTWQFSRANGKCARSGTDDSLIGSSGCTSTRKFPKLKLGHAPLANPTLPPPPPALNTGSAPDTLVEVEDEEDEAISIAVSCALLLLLVLLLLLAFALSVGITCGGRRRRCTFALRNGCRSSVVASTEAPASADTVPGKGCHCQKGELDDSTMYRVRLGRGACVEAQATTKKLRQTLSGITLAIRREKERTNEKRRKCSQHATVIQQKEKMFFLLHLQERQQHALPSAPSFTSGSSPASYCMESASSAFK